VLSAAGLTKFLEVTKKGYCQQFSSAMAVLARLLGIPSRVAYGYTAGSPNAARTFTVTTHDAHAWPELYFQGYGWLRFEPTPSGTNGQGTAYAPTYSVTPGSVSGPPALATGPASGTGTATGQATSHVLPPNLRQILGQDPGGTAPGPASDALSPWEIFGLVVAGLAVLALVAPWCVRRVVRRLRWRHGRPPRIRARDIAWAHAAWQELRDDLMDYGAGYLPSESPRAVAARAGTELVLTGTAQAALGRIAMAEERARYAPAPADGSGLRADSVTVRRAIAAAVPRGARWRARLLPASVVGPVLAMVALAANPYRGRIGAEGGRRLTLERLGRFRPGGSA
jgi:hypothetical protein